MPGHSLSPLQESILDHLSDVEPPFTLTGGGALALYLGHRTTRDLHLFWRDRGDLGQVEQDVATRLRQADLAVEKVQSGSTFARLRVSSDEETTVVDLVAEPVASIESPARLRVSRRNEIQVDTLREILANKLCALLSRSEVRDLVDLEALLDSGSDLQQGLRDANQKDAGFSPLNLAWSLRSLDISALWPSMLLATDETADLVEFKESLIEQLVASGQPG